MENNDIKNTDDIPQSESADILNSRETALFEAAQMDERPAQLQNILSHKIIPYNSDMKRLKLPEYGRHIHSLLDECLKIEDRDERTRFANEIVRVVSLLLPDHVGENGNTKKIWDHLMIMSDFKLDVDSPYVTVTKETLTPEAAPIPYYGNDTISRHYGRLIESMIGVVSDMPGGDEKDRLILMIANQMKKLLLTYNPTGVSDERVIKDLNTMSKGKIAIDPSTYKLQEFKSLPKDTQSSLPKKKRKVKNTTFKKHNQF